MASGGYSTRGHRRKGSLAHLSTSTAASNLPAYYTLSPHARSTPNLRRGSEDEFGDDPPSYEADDDSSDGERRTPLSPPPVPHQYRRRNNRPHHLSPPQPPSRGPSHRSRPSGSVPSPLALPPPRALTRARTPTRGRNESSSGAEGDADLDGLLARSIAALEASTALLQSSMSTQTSFSAIVQNDSPPHSAHPPPVPTSTIRARQSPHPHAIDLDMESVSRSLPDAAGPSPLHQRLRSHTRNRSSSSTDLRANSDTDAAAAATAAAVAAGELQLGVAGRARFIARAPRALTQYIDADAGRTQADDATLRLPSTLGLRAMGSTHHLLDSSTEPTTPAHTRPSLSPLTFRPSRPAPPPPPAPAKEPEPPPPAAPPPTPSASTLLASFLARRPSAPATSRIIRAPQPRLAKRRASIETAAATEPARPISYHYDQAQTQLPHRAGAATPSTPSSSTTVLRPSRSPTPTRSAYRGSPRTRPRSMTPPLEVSSPAPSPSNDDEDSPRSSSDAAPQPVLSVLALRRIIAEQPPAPPRGLQPRTPAVPTVGTSHATASISRLFTRATHMHAGSADARAARRSALKPRVTAPPTPSPAPSEPPTPSPSFLGLTLPFGGSATSSGRSTPSGSRVSFAALPDDTTGAGPPAAARRRSRSRSRSARAKGKGRRDAEVDGSISDGAMADGWWAAWLVGGLGGGMGSGAPDMPGVGAGAAARERKVWGRGFHGMEDFAM